MSNRVTRSSTRNTTIGDGTPTTTTKSTASHKRSQRKKVNDVNSDMKHLNGESNADDVHVTPPKQRKSCVKANTLSPSTLLHRLSLGEEDENQPEIVNEPEIPKSKIDNARKVLNAAETEDLYGREKEINELNEFLLTNSAKKTSASIYISGQPGIFFIQIQNENFRNIYVDNMNRTDCDNFFCRNW